jgi:post-segregation antitoxin (ccd killing protein)
MTTVLSVRVRKSLKEEAEALGINIREVVEKALEEEIKKIKIERLKKIIDDALRSMDVSVEEWVNTVRESRLER